MESCSAFTHSFQTVEDTLVDKRKEAVSIRMSSSDVLKIKKLSRRLGARDSDVIRFAVKNMLSRLAPLCDSEAKGRNLIPVFVESGFDIVRFFDLDAERIESILNAETESHRRVERDDIVLMTRMGAEMPYAALLLQELNPSEGALSTNTNLGSAFKAYLYEKYLYRGQVAQTPEPERGMTEEPVALAKFTRHTS